MGVLRKVQDLSSVKAIIWYGTVDVTALKAIVGTDRADMQLRFVKSERSIFAYDSTSVEAPDDIIIVKPDDVLITDPGRWYRIDGNSLPVYDEIGVVSDGQTAFILSKQPVVDNAVEMISVGGIELLNMIDFTVSGKNVTYTGTIPFVTGEIVIFKYDSFEG